MRFYLDENLPPRVASMLRAEGYDALSSHECGRNGLSDEQQLRLAAAEGRCFVTRNRNHFLLLTTRFLENQWPHAGILIVPFSLPNRDFTRIAHALITYAALYPTGLPSYAVDFLHPPAEHG